MMNELETRKSDFLREEYYLFRHQSGLRVIVFPKKLTTSYAIFAARYGSVDNEFRLESDGKFTKVPDGIAHFLEHKLFEEPDGGDAFNRFATLGANANAYTTNDMTAFLFSCTNHFYEALGDLLDFVKTPHFTDKSVEKERGIIAQEIKMYEDQPQRAAYMMMLDNLFEKHPVKVDVAGTVGSIKKITPELLYECCRVFYNLSNMLLIVCGDVDCEKVSEVCDRFLKDEPPVKIIRSYPVEKPEVARAYSERRMQASKPLFAIGMKDTTLPDDGVGRMKRYAAFTILDDVLFGKSGGFYNKLYEEGLLSSQFDFGYDTSIGYAYNGVYGESSDPEAVLERLKAVCEAAKNGIPTEDFERSKRALYASMVKGFDSTEEIANSLLSYDMIGGDIFAYTDILAGTTIGDVVEVARDIFRPEKFTMAVVKPLKED